MLVMS